MFSTNPANWVTFEDEPLFQSPQKAGGSHSVFRTNGLKLLLPKMHDSSSQSSSSSNISLSSPMNDYYFIPGPPSNSPLCTPTRDYPASPCFPKSGSHLYPIPELSSSINVHPAPQKLDGILQTGHHSESSVPKSEDDVNVTQENLKKLEDCSETQTLFQYVQNNCAFSSPFWTEDSPLSSAGAPRTDSGFGSLKEKEGLPDQKSLNQGSFNYICERLEHLETDSSDNERTLTSMPCIYTGDGISPFIPCTLFSRQRKDGWPFMLRIPEKKNMMSSRQWGPIYLRVLPGGILQMYYEKGLEKPFKEFQLQPFCRLSEPKLENCSISGRIHTVKIEYVSYTEKKKYHPKAEWIKTLWTMNLQRQKSLKAKMNRRACLGSLTEIESDSVIQVSIGTAKYESAYKAIVWKIDRLPDKNTNPDHPHSLSYKLELGSDQEIPSDWYPFATVQFVVLDECPSGTEVKSLGIENDVQPQKHVTQKAYYNCQVEIEKKWIRLEGEDPNKCGSCQMQ